MIVLLAYGKRAKPEGMLDIAQFLRGCGETVRMEHLYTTPPEKALAKINAEPSHVGIGVYTEISGGLRPLIAAVRKRWPTAAIVLGGWHITDDTLAVETDLVNLAEHLVIGEGEYAMRDILNGAAPGIHRGQLLSQEDFRRLPLPNVHRINQYFRALPDTVVFSRGCPMHCTFCSGHRKRVIRRQPGVAAHYLKSRYATLNRPLFVNDDIFTSDIKWLREFVAEIERQKCTAPLRCFIHGRDFDEERASLLSRAHVYDMSLGAESGDNGVLKLIGKQATVEDFERIHKITKCYKGMALHPLWMIGLPGETQETLQKTLHAAARIGTVRPGFGFALPYPGTVFWRHREKWGTICSPDWSRWTTHRPAFLPFGLNAATLTAAMKKAKRIRG